MVSLKYFYFFVAQIDKTSINVAFVCHRHDSHALMNELGLNNIRNITSTYMKPTKQVDKVVLDQISFVRNKLHLEVIEIKKKLLICNGIPNCIRIPPKQDF